MIFYTNLDSLNKPLISNRITLDAAEQAVTVFRLRDKIVREQKMQTSQLPQMVFVGVCKCSYLTAQLLIVMELQDGDIVIHEVTHGLSNRLHGNATGLNSNMSIGMGEGWSDFYAFCLLSSSNDPVNGVYAGGGHVLINAFGGAIGTDNYYYGIRSFPKATLATTGGPNNRPHNPLTFADLDSTQEDRSDGAFAPKSGPHISISPSQVHRAGEVWSSALWEVRALMITRLGHVAGNQKALQVVTDGMKLSAIDPTFLQGRDAIIAAATALPLAPTTSADAEDVRNGFRMRGMGFFCYSRC